MATKKKTNEETQAPESGMTTEQSTEQIVPGREEEHVEQTPETVEAAEASGDTQEDVAAALQKAAVTASREPADGEGLVDLSVLADRHRVPSWQQAAVLRLMGWVDDKRVSDAEYRAALENLKHRRIGGGRR